MYKIILPPFVHDNVRVVFVGLYDAIASAKCYISLYSLDSISIQDEDGFMINVQPLNN